ncbi:MAG: DUF2270 domain-containing protein [Pseudomonadota bacterium]
MSEFSDEWNEWTSPPGGTGNTLDNADVGALAHLYRGEVYRSTIWRTRLDATTNWSVVTLGLAMSVSFASPEASPLPLLLVGVLIVMFLILEARRYRYFNVWRARCRWIERNFYAPLLLQSTRPDPGEWQDVLAKDYLKPQYHVGLWRAIGRRIRRNYMWIFGFQALAFVGKIVVHPTPLTSVDLLFERMTVGPFPGYVVLLFGMAFHASWIGLALVTRHRDRRKHGDREQSDAMG